jgi:hypothetical protein
MRRISHAFDAGRRVRARRNFAVVAFVVAAGVLLFGSRAALAADGNDGVQSPPLKTDIGCALRDLELFTLIERNGNSGLSTTATLVEASETLQTARAACQVGDVDNALALYETALRRLENPSDVARR